MRDIKDIREILNEYPGGYFDEWGGSCVDMMMGYRCI